MWARLRLRWWSARARMRVIAFVVIFIAANTAGMSAAAAADGGSSVWQWMEIYDSHGNSAWAYSLSLDYGGFTEADNAIFGGITALCWVIYQWLVIFSIWLINFALSLQWFDPLMAPANGLANSIQEILGLVGLQNTLLLLTGAVGCALILRGAWATAIWELIVALTVLALGTDVFADPVDMAAGTKGDQTRVAGEAAGGHGWLGGANSAGLRIAESFWGKDSAGKTGKMASGYDPADTRRDISQSLVDTFLRAPHQLINYGKILKDCQSEYNRSLNVTQEIARPPKGYFAAGGQKPGLERTDTPLPEKGDEDYKKWKAFVEYVEVSYGSKDMETLTKAAGDILSWNSQREVDPPEPRNIIKECDEEAGERAANPSVGMAGDAVTMGIGVIFLVGIALVLAFTLIYFGIQFLWCCIRSLWEFVIALAPNRSRSGLWQTLAQALWCLIGVAITSIFLVGYLLLIKRVSGEFRDENIMKSFLFVDILLAAGLFMFVRLRKHMKRAADRTAGLLGKRPGKSPAKMPRRGERRLTYGQKRVMMRAGTASAKATGRAGANSAKVGGTVAKAGAVGSAVAGFGAGAIAFRGGRGAVRKIRNRKHQSEVGTGSGNPSRESTLSSPDGSSADKAHAQTRQRANVEVSLKERQGSNQAEASTGRRDEVLNGPSFTWLRERGSGGHAAWVPAQPTRPFKPRRVQTQQQTAVTSLLKESRTQGQGSEPTPSAPQPIKQASRIVGLPKQPSRKR